MGWEKEFDSINSTSELLVESPQIDFIVLSIEKMKKRLFCSFLVSKDGVSSSVDTQSIANLIAGA